MDLEAIGIDLYGEVPSFRYVHLYDQLHFVVTSKNTAMYTFPDVQPVLL